jgi:hypothetical protein
MALSPAVLKAQQPAAFDSRDLSGHWDRMSPIESFADVETGESNKKGLEEPPFTPEGRARYELNKPGYGPRRAMVRNDPGGRCYPNGLVRNLTSGLGLPNGAFEIVQTPERMLMFFQWFHDWREVWMDGRTLPALDEVEPRWNGYSVGRWEGDTLIVEALGFDDRAWMDKFGHPHSEQMRLEERYRRVDADTLELVMTVTDPVTYARPWKSDRKLFRLNREKSKRWDEQVFCIAEEEFAFQKLIESGNVPPDFK